RWTGVGGKGTAGYGAYGRDHEIRAPGREVIWSSSDAHFLGDASKWNPELLLVASLSSCHMLWYLHLCAKAGVVVLGYEDSASGEMELDTGGGGRFVGVTLRPRVLVADNSMLEQAGALHAEAHSWCFIARSVNFPVTHAAETEVVPR
ncbi:MAG: OsmC family protein, partial [Acidimicrobiales bacterium]